MNDHNIKKTASEEAAEKEINMIIMREMGLEIGNNNRIYDQDTGTELKINGMNIVAPGCYQKQSMEFNPYNNKKMMSQLFGYFLNKISDEGGPNVIAFYNGDNSRIECKTEDNEVISSGSYSKETLRYVDLVMRLNDEDPSDINLSKYDINKQQKK